MLLNKQAVYFLFSDTHLHSAGIYMEGDICHNLGFKSLVSIVALKLFINEMFLFCQGQKLKKNKQTYFSFFFFINC